jgi:hypothetical protein
MKKNLLLVLLLVLCGTVWAQQQQVWVKPLEFGKASPKKNNFRVNSSLKQALLTVLYANGFEWPEASYSHTTEQGDIYKLPVDNMPCLVPDISKSGFMPNSMPPFTGYIPNAIQPWPIIPDQKRKKQ